MQSVVMKVCTHNWVTIHVHNHKEYYCVWCGKGKVNKND